MDDDALAGRTWLAKLRDTARHRAQFDSLFHRLLGEEVHFLPEDGEIVEIGAGDGQFSRAIPFSSDRVVLTEPNKASVARLRTRFPSHRVHEVSAETLPFEDGSVAAVVGCCVLDVVDDLVQVTAECRRVLRPGGVLLHLLDMSADLWGLMNALVEDAEVCVIPNVTNSSADSDWPEDLRMVPRAQLEGIERVLVDPMSWVAKIRRSFDGSPVDALQTFLAIHESTDGRRALRAELKRAMKLASGRERERLAAFRGYPMSSCRLFHERLLAASDGFHVERAEVARCWEQRRNDPAVIRSIVGFVQSAAYVDHSSSPHACTKNAPEASGLGYAELGVHVFRARRI